VDGNHNAGHHHDHFDNHLLLAGQLWLAFMEEVSEAAA
jgi:hypothetical protein